MPTSSDHTTPTTDPPTCRPDVPPLFGEADLVHSYLRAQALADGVLIDVSADARDAGIRIPVAVTAAVYHHAIALTDAARRAGCDERGRRWDLVWMLRLAMGRTRPSAFSMLFRLLVVRDRQQPEEVELRAVVGPGDTGEPVLTVLMPDED